MHSAFGESANDEVSSDDYGIWAYGDYFTPNRRWKVVAAAGGGWSDNVMQAESLGLPLTGNFGGSWYSLDTRVSYWTDFRGFTVSPRLSLGYSDSTQSSYTATSPMSALDVNVGSTGEGLLTVDPAVLFGKKLHVQQTLVFPQVRVGLHESIGPRSASLLTSGQAQAVDQGLPVPHTQGMAELRVDLGSSSDNVAYHGLSGNVAVKQLFGGGASSTEAMATIKYRW